MNKDEIFSFPKGIPGFENYKKYKLVRDQEAPLAQLISVDEPEIGFILTPPEIFFKGYSLEVDEESEKTIGIRENSEIEYWAILTYHSDITKSSINLRAPILLNLNNKSGVQLILNDDKYSSRQPLLLNQTQQEGVAK